ncbi:enoyl-[acyl-carrier-protein] reductase, mitochondrial-like [Diorhabda carinulata]|uniref:enoyl-[acyl-carrier-protein] reductase, mitochondrial-like n=1 Tax=Diorhabda carinulata TaxID=1163345 RepID=UPI0025A0C510|nr:enoyl-[acyl-carrier-protein] reductase, mitochondrial-like [Diorhabda carinulata]
MPLKLTFDTNGDPAKVVYITAYDMPIPSEKEVLIQTIAAPVNPVDINVVQGKYTFNFEQVGFEGIGRVIKTGKGVKNFKIGDHVVPTVYAGTWRTHFTLLEDNLLRIPKDMDIALAATFYVNPVTVYAMLKDFIKLEPGDTVIQNGANSACGVIVIQMCKTWGINTVNVVRDRPNINELKQFLKDLGATYVLTEKEIKETNIFKTGQLDMPSLGLNCIGGDLANNILRHLKDEGVLVTYGGMSLEPIKVSTTSLVFKNIKIEGFNVTRWVNKEQNVVKLPAIYKDIIDMIMNGDLKAPPHVFVNFMDYKKALSSVLTKNGMVGSKYILDFRTPPKM